MYKIIVIFLIFMFHDNVFADDCFFHPRFIHEVKIESCEILSANNAGDISIVAKSSVVAALFPGAILRVYEQKILQINPAEGGREYSEVPWRVTGKSKTFLLRSKDINICFRYKKKSVVKIRTETDCECDTGARPDGYCTLIVAEAYSDTGGR